jgi:hypothetical protein
MLRRDLWQVDHARVDRAPSLTRSKPTIPLKRKALTSAARGCVDTNPFLRSPDR